MALSQEQINQLKSDLSTKKASPEANGGFLKNLFAPKAEAPTFESKSGLNIFRGVDSGKLKEPQQSGFSETVEDFKDIGENIISRISKRGEDFEGETVLGRTKALTGGVADVSGDITIGAAKLLIPQTTEDAIAKFVQGGTEKIMTNEQAQGLIQLASQLREQNPELAKGLDAITNAAFTALDVAGVGKGANLARRGVLEVADTAGDIASSARVIGDDLLAGTREITTGVSRGIDDVISKAKSSTDIKTGLTGKLDTFARKSIDNSVNELIDSRVTSSRRARELLERNVDVRENLKDIEVYNGLKVKDNKINADLAVDTIQNRIDVALDAKAKILPQIDKFGETIKPFDEAFQTDIRDKVTALKLPPVEEEKILKSIEKQLEGIPSEMLPSEADAFRAKFRNAASDAKGRLKRDSEFSVLQEVFRDSVFKATDNVSFGEAGSFAKLNDYVKNQIETINYLENVVNGSVVKGGRLKNYFARAIGAIAGSGQGIIGSIVGAELSGFVADIITNNQLGSSVKMSLLKEVVSDPKALKEIQKLVDAAENYRPLELPSPTEGAFRSQTGSGKTIELPARSKTITDEGQAGIINRQ